jgi:hypothetical protein
VAPTWLLIAPHPFDPLAKLGAATCLAVGL